VAVSLRLFDFFRRLLPELVNFIVAFTLPAARTRMVADATSTGVAFFAVGIRAPLGTKYQSRTSFPAPGAENVNVNPPAFRSAVIFAARPDGASTFARAALISLVDRPVGVGVGVGVGVVVVVGVGLAGAAGPAGAVEAGVTAFDDAEAGPVPTALVAVTVNV